MAALYNMLVFFVQMTVIFVAVFVIVPLFIIAFFVVGDRAKPSNKKVEGTQRPWIK